MNKLDAHAIWLLAIMVAVAGSCLLTYKPSPAPKPFVYHYQWPGEFGDQKMMICISKGHGFDCRVSRTSDEL